MKFARITILSLIMTFFFLNQIQGQRVFDRIKRKVEYKVNRKIDQKVDEAIDKVLEPKKKEPKSKDEPEEREKNKNNEETPSEHESTDNEPDVDENPEPVETITEKKELELWTNKYDFVPGDQVLFYDDQQGEELGEFPSRWDLINGGAENVVVDGENVIDIYGRITPLFEDEFNLPEKFTLEFDAYFGEKKAGSYLYEINLGRNIPKIIIGHGTIRANGISEGKVPDKVFKDFYNQWHHISIAFNKRSLKLYFNQFRLVNIPNLKTPPSTISMWACCTDNGHKFLIKNVRLAEGGKKLYEREFSEGKIVTHAIIFETNKADLKPQSFAEIRRIAELMEKYPDVRFSVEGHTDSDGTDSHNIELSEARSMAVKNALVDMGIKANRLEIKGWGEQKPISSNQTPEGKAQNRRVEFVRLDQ